MRPRPSQSLRACHPCHREFPPCGTRQRLVRVGREVSIAIPLENPHVAELVLDQQVEQPISETVRAGEVHDQQSRRNASSLDHARRGEVAETVTEMDRNLRASFVDQCEVVMPVAIEIATD